MLHDESDIIIFTIFLDNLFIVTLPIFTYVILFNLVYVVLIINEYRIIFGLPGISSDAIFCSLYVISVILRIEIIISIDNCTNDDVEFDTMYT